MNDEEPTALQIVLAQRDAYREERDALASQVKALRADLDITTFANTLLASQLAQLLASENGGANG